MAAGDVHTSSDGSRWLETEIGPLLKTTCMDCGRDALASLQYMARARCGECNRRYVNLDEILARGA